jgi:transcriptional antiterminator NusG
LGADFDNIVGAGPLDAGHDAQIGSHAESGYVTEGGFVYPQTEEQTYIPDRDVRQEGLVLTPGTLLGKDISPDLPWYVVYTRCHHEARVAKHLAKSSFTVVFPKRRTWSRRRDRRKVIDLPLFPGYLFVQTEPFPRRFAEILQTPGLARLLGNGSGPEPVPQSEMRSLIILLSSAKLLEPHPYFEEGDQAIVVSGPLKGAIGYILTARPNKRKLVLSLELLGRSVAVHLSDEEVDLF